MEGVYGYIGCNNVIDTRQVLSALYSQKRELERRAELGRKVG